MYFTVNLKFSKHLFYTYLGKVFFLAVEECNILINSDINIVGNCIMFETINNFGFSVLIHLYQFVAPVGLTLASS